MDRSTHSRGRLASLVIALFLVGLPTFGATVVVTDFTTVIKPNHYYLEHGLRNETNCTMTYDDALVDTLGAAFELDYTDPGGTSMDAYPSGSVGGAKKGGTWYPGDPLLSGMPLAMPSLGHDFRIQWKVSSQNAYDPDDKWWATINVIFDGGTATSEPVAADRDYDVVIELISYDQDDFSDLPKEAGQNSYWWFARNPDSSIKPFVLHIDGTNYEWAVRYKFFQNAGDKDNKVHVKFIPVDYQQAAPYIDHSLKVFTDAAEDYLQYIDFTGYSAEETLANEKINNSSLYVKTISAGFEVYTGAMILRNDYLRTVVDNTAPDAPTGLAANPIGLSVDLDWDDSAETSLEAYGIWRKRTGDASYSNLTSTVRVSSYSDTTVEGGESYSYYVTAIDRSFNESSASTVASADVQPVTNYTLTIYATNGVVVETPDLAEYTDGSNVELLATADPGFVFAGWSGDASGAINPLAVAMDGDKTITALFTYVSGPSFPSAGAIHYKDPLVPAGLQAGDTFHFVFVTSPANTIDSTWNLTQLNAHVNDIANDGGGYSGSLVARLGLTWYAIASDTTTDARDNSVVSAPVYRIDGALVANGSNDMWDGSIATNINITEQNTVYDGVVRTGSLSDGTAGGNPFGVAGGQIDRGFSSASDVTWIEGGNEGDGVRRNAYALSAQIKVKGPAGTVLVIR